MDYVFKIYITDDTDCIFEICNFDAIRLYLLQSNLRDACVPLVINFVCCIERIFTVTF